MSKRFSIPLFLVAFLLGSCGLLSKKSAPPSPPAAPPAAPVKIEPPAANPPMPVSPTAAPTPPAAPMAPIPAPTPPMALAPTVPPAALTPAGDLKIEGTYSVQGTNPGGRGGYRGTAAIAKEGQQYRVHWSVGTVYDGVGTLKGNVFAVEWGNRNTHLGTVTYTVEPSGVMKGTWFVDKNPNLLGTETLTPR